MKTQHSAPSHFIVALIYLCVCHFAHSFIQADEKPNFIVILTDDQSWVGTSQQIILGDPRTKSDYFQTPNLEKLANLGMRFTQGYSPAASCCPTRRAIQVSQTPARHEYNADRERWCETYNARLNIPRMLKTIDSNYQTAHFGKWDHRYDLVTPHEQGFDFSDGFTGNFTGGAKKSGGPAATPDPKLIDTITDKAIHFISRNQARGKPFYLQVSHYAVHLDIYYNQETFDRVKTYPLGKKHNMPEFGAMTEDMDAGVGRILNHLDELNLMKNTYVIFLSDNGGRNTIPKAPDIIEHRNAPLRDGKHSFYEGGIRVPFFVAGPDIKSGSVCDVPVTGLDILPTIADIAGFSKPLPDGIDGGSMRELLANEGQGTIERLNPFLVFHQGVDRKAISAIRDGDFKLVKTWEQNQIELFDLSKDISEANDLSKTMPEKTKELDDKLTQFLKSVGAETRRTVKKK